MAFGHQGTEILNGFKTIALKVFTANDEAFEANFESNKLMLESRLKEMEMTKYNPDNSAFFDFLPQYFGNFSFNDGIKDVQGKCFQKIRISSYKSTDGSVNLAMDFQDAISLFCTETFILATDSQYYSREILLS